MGSHEKASDAAQQDMLASCLTDISSSLHVDGRLRRASVNLLIPFFWLGPNCGCFRVHLLYIHILYTFIFVLFQHAGNVQQCLLWNSNSLIHWGKKIGVVIKVLPFFNNLSPLLQRSGLLENIRCVHCSVVLRTNQSVENVSVQCGWHRRAYAVCIQRIISKMALRWCSGDELLNTVVVFVFFVLVT